MIEATFDLNLQAIKNDADPLIVPLMLAQTNKNAEKKISCSVSNMLAVSCVLNVTDSNWLIPFQPVDRHLSGDNETFYLV